MTRRLPAMQALSAFEAAARTASLTRAAEELHLTHGAISHQVKALEAEFGVALLERAGRGIRLTDEGARFATRLRAALGEIAEAVRELAERRNPRRLRISVLPSFAASWLLPRVGRFLAAHPDIDLDIRSSNELADFRRDEVDAAIRYGPGEWPGIAAERLMDDELFPVCSPRLNGGRLPAKPADLARFALLHSEGEAWKPWFEAAGLDWDEPTRGAAFEVSSHALQAAIDGHGIALGRRTLVGDALANGSLVRLFDIAVPTRFHCYLVYPPRLAQSPKLQAFRDWLFAEVGEPARKGRGRSPRERDAANRSQAQRDKAKRAIARPRSKRSQHAQGGAKGERVRR